MRKVERVVFLSLVLDLFAFTIPLPLFPRIIEWYTQREADIPNGFLARTLGFVAAIRSTLYKSGASSKRWDVVLLGGLMGSLFSTLQFFVSPWIGSLSDVYGRRNVLLVTMLGNILSAAVWVKSTTFASYTLSRAIGGLSEGNVQLAIAILSDVTSPKNRAKALAHVGIAFAICFIIGPPIGAFFSTRPMPIKFFGDITELNIYATPALLTLVLLVVETVFLMVALPETRGKAPGSSQYNSRAPSPSADEKSSKQQNGTAPVGLQTPVQKRLATLRALKSVHFWFLGVFSGVEFTLTFLSYDLFDWDNSKNGRLIGFIGIISAILQGGYVRRAIPKVGEGIMARRGVSSCILALALMSSLPHVPLSVAPRVLYVASTCLAFTSATVVNSLTAYASLQCDDGVDLKDNVTGKPIESSGEPLLAKGRALGEFRSSGQLGRAIGPLLACASYWTFGPSITYSASAMAMTLLAVSMKSIAQKPIL